jgi:hypothetical protein
MEGQSLIFFGQKYLQKKGCVIERIFRGHWFVNYQKKITYLVCGKYVAQTIILHLCPKLNFPSRNSFHKTHCQG